MFNFSVETIKFAYVKMEDLLLNEGLNESIFFLLLPGFYYVFFDVPQKGTYFRMRIGLRWSLHHILDDLAIGQMTHNLLVEIISNSLQKAISHFILLSTSWPYYRLFFPENLRHRAASFQFLVEIMKDSFQFVRFYAFEFAISLDSNFRAVEINKNFFIVEVSIFFNPLARFTKS